MAFIDVGVLAIRKRESDFVDPFSCIYDGLGKQLEFHSSLHAACPTSPHPGMAVRFFLRAR
jgi:hypothetical protein